MTKNFVNRVEKEYIVDTKNYRYKFETGNRGARILRISLDKLDTTAAINGWEVAKVIDGE